MLNTIFSGDFPRSRTLSGLLLVIFIGLAAAPFLFDGVVAYRAMSTICVLIILAASYDILLGYTAIVSFAHAMFYGIGAYGVAIAIEHMGNTWGAVGIGLVSGMGVALVAALVLGLFSLRVKAIFFALVTLAVATGFLILVSKLYTITGGEDGISFRTPRELGPAFKVIEEKYTGFDLPTFFSALFSDETKVGDALFQDRFNGKILLYYVLFGSATVLFLVMLRMMNSPFGRVLMAIRENEFRAEALGYRTVYYRTINVCIAGVLAAFAGGLTALSVKYVNPDSVLSFNLMIDVLLIVVIGGMGTLYGSIIGAVLLVTAHTYLSSWMGSGYETLAQPYLDAGEKVPFLYEFIAPERWYLWLGLLFVLSVYFFPRGVVGQLRMWSANRKARALESSADAEETATSH